MTTSTQLVPRKNTQPTSELARRRRQEANSVPARPGFWDYFGNRVAIGLVAVLVVVLGLILLFAPRPHPRAVHVTAPAQAHVVVNWPIVIGPNGDSIIRHLSGGTNAEKARVAVIIAANAGRPVHLTRNGAIVERNLPRERALALANNTDANGLYSPVQEGDTFTLVNGHVTFTRAHR